MKRIKKTKVKTPRKQSKKIKDNTSYFGGYTNLITGAGTSIDKSAGGFYTPTLLQLKNFYETLYVESWAAAKFVNIPVDDMLIRWREFIDMENESIELVESAELEFNICSKLSKSMKAGSLYGTGLFIILTKEASPDTPLDINRMQPGDLSNILTLDRFDATVIAKEKNPMSKNYGLPVGYRITLRDAGVGYFNIHHSRVLRFDGITPTSDNSWCSGYFRDWGVASIIPVLTEILQDSGVSKGIAQLVTEASVPVQKIEGFDEILAGQSSEGEMSLQERMERTTALRGIYRTVFMGEKDSFERHDVTFSGLADIIDRNAIRLSAATNIPVTRFWGKSAVGMNATGDGDARDYAMHVAANQAKQLPRPLRIIDAVLEKHLGLTEKIKYRFPSLIDMSDDDKANILLKKSQAIVPLVPRIIDEDEARNALDGDDILGNLDDLVKMIPDESIAATLQKQDSKRFMWPWQKRK